MGLLNSRIDASQWMMMTSTLALVSSRSAATVRRAVVVAVATGGAAIRLHVGDAVVVVVVVQAHRTRTPKTMSLVARVHGVVVLHACADLVLVSHRRPPAAHP